MDELDLATVAAANETWVLEPEGSEVVETAEYRMVRFPERFPEPLRLQWVRSTRPADVVLREVVARAAEFGLPEINVSVRLTAPEGFEKALLSSGAKQVYASDVLAMALPADVKAPEVPGFEVRWATTLEVGREANAVGVEIFGGTIASDEQLVPRVAAHRDSVAAETGGLIVAYLDGTPVAIAGVELVNGVARLSAGGVLKAHRRSGLYRALVATRLTYATERGATMALCQGDVTTSSPILHRLGFTSYGQERFYRLPLA